MSRFLFIAVSWIVLFVSCAFVVDGAADLIDVRTALFVAVVPLLASAAAHGPARVGRALRQSLAPEDVTHEARGESAVVLRDMGGLAFGAGLVVFLGSLVGVFNGIAVMGAEASSGYVMQSFGEMTLAPVYGLALWLFLWAPLASGLEAGGESVGAELAESGV